MTAQPVASVPKDISPPRAAVPIALSTNDFAQLLGDGVTPSSSTPSTSGTSSSGSTTGTAATTTSSDGHVSKKSNDDTSAPTNLVVAVPLQHQAPPPKAQTQDAAPAQATNNAVAAAPTASTALPTGTNAPAPVGPNNAAAAAAAALPTGAAEMDTRIAVGMPSFFSQPKSMLTGQPLPATTTPDDDADADAGADAASTTQAAAPDDFTPVGATAKLAAPTGAVQVAQLHDAPSLDAAGVAIADPGSSSASTNAQTSDATTFALPVSGDSQVAPPATIAVTAATVAPNLAPPPVFDQVAFSLKQAADGDGGLNTINIQLKPASLGAIQVKLDVGHDGKISAVISADRSDTLNLLRQDSHGLEQALRDAGLKADSGSLSFNLRGDQQSFAQNSGGGSNAPAYAQQSGLATADSPTPRYSRHQGALDIEV